jgi:HAMP domain-containing protein
MKPLPLSTRVVAGFAAGALALSTIIAAASYQLSRGSLLAERERTAVRATYFDAAAVRADLTAANPDIVEILRSLDTGAVRRPVVHRDGAWYARSADTDASEAVPAGLVERVSRGRPGMQRVRTGGHPSVVIGVPLSDSTAFYEVHSLEELDRTLQLLALVLSVAALTTAALGAGFGAYATRYVLRPLYRVADAAEEIAAGDLSARLDPAVEPDLTRLTTSFNTMVDRLAERMQRDRRFAADVSHELRSPLQTLQAAASVLTNRRAALDDRSATAVKLISDEVDRFQALVVDLIELARSDQPADRSPVRAVELATQLAAAHGLADGSVDGDPDAVWNVDRRRCRRSAPGFRHRRKRMPGRRTPVRFSGPVDSEGAGRARPQRGPLRRDRHATRSRTGPAAPGVPLGGGSRGTADGRSTASRPAAGERRSPTAPAPARPALTRRARRLRRRLEPARVASISPYALAPVRAR